MRVFLAIPILTACARPAPPPVAIADPAPAAAAPADLDEVEQLIGHLAEHRPGALFKTFNPATGYLVVDADTAAHASAPIVAEHLCGRGAMAYLGDLEEIAFQALADDPGVEACREADRFVECSFTAPGHNGARYTLDFVGDRAHRLPQLARIRIDKTMGPHADDARAVADQTTSQPCPPAYW